VIANPTPDRGADQPEEPQGLPRELDQEEHGEQVQEAPENHTQAGVARGTVLLALAQGDLLDREAPMRGQDRDEAMEIPVEVQGRCRFLAHRTEATADVGEARGGHPAGERMEDPRLQAVPERIRAGMPPPDHEVDASLLDGVENAREPTARPGSRTRA
jgi:hypothetical protein